MLWYILLWMHICCCCVWFKPRDWLGWTSPKYVMQ